MKKNPFILTMIMALVIMFALAGCSDDSATNDSIEKETPAKVEAETETAYPITIKHALGETVIESKPERIVTIQWANHDIALALGVVPVGFSAANFGVQDDSGLLPWTAEKLEELGEKKSKRIPRYRWT